MKKVYSNGSQWDYIINPYSQLIGSSKDIYIAVPYFTEADEIIEASKHDRNVNLLVGLNSSTSPTTLKTIHGLSGIVVRYLTHRFHAKMYIADNAALVGSSNLTDGGLRSNREATVFLNSDDDQDVIEELRALFAELWEAGHVLTGDKLESFANAHAAVTRSAPDLDAMIETAVGGAEPININVASKTKTTQHLFKVPLERLVYEQYQPAFNEVTLLLEQNNLRRPELQGVGLSNETNRFLNWVRVTYAPGEEEWQSAPIRIKEDRKTEILGLGRKWTETDQPKIPPYYIEWLETVASVFGTDEAITEASRDRITQGLMSLHAFSEQYRFVKGGANNLPIAFWSANGQDLHKVKRTLRHLIHGTGEFILRLHDVLYSPNYKLAFFGKFCALELFGTVRPDKCPPMDGRMAKALRYLGFDVPGA